MMLIKCKYYLRLHSYLLHGNKNFCESIFMNEALQGFFLLWELTSALRERRQRKIQKSSVHCGQQNQNANYAGPQEVGVRAGRVGCKACVFHLRSFECLSRRRWGLEFFEDCIYRIPGSKRKREGQRRSREGSHDGTTDALCTQEKESNRCGTFCLTWGEEV